MELTLEQALQKGIEAHRSGNVQEADQYYTAILKANPKHPDANHNMGVLAVGVGKVQEALPFFKTALEANSSIAQFWLSYIDALIKLERMDDAKAVREQARNHGVTGEAFDKLGNQFSRQQDGLNKSAGPKNSDTKELPQSQMQLLINLYKQGQYQDALSKIRSLDVQHLNSPVILNLIGALSAKLGLLEESIDAFRKVVSIKPNDSQAYYNLGKALKDDGSYEEAIEAYIKAISINPKYAEAYYNLGNAFKELNQLDEAIKAFTDALSIRPNYIDALINMADSKHGQGKHQEAINTYKKVLSINPDYAEAYNNIGNAYKEIGNPDEAINAYKRAIEIKPDYEQAYNNMGNALNDQGKIEEAIQALDKAISIKPDYAEAHNSMGNVFHAQGKFHKAIESYRRAILIKPNFEEAFTNIGYSQKSQGNLNQAILSYEKALSINPEFAQAHFNLSFAYLNAGKVKEGLQKHEWRWKIPKNYQEKRQFVKPRWDGKSPLKNKTILVWGEQGPQDILVWSSALEFLTRIAGHCILECPSKLVPLLSRSFPEVTVKAENREKDLVRADFDFHIPLGSLFKCFFQKVSNRTVNRPFLKIDLLQKKYWKSRLDKLGHGPFVGISWKSPLITQRRLPNYTDIVAWEPILSLPNITFINLQSGDFRSDLGRAENKFGIKVHNFDDLDHFDDLDNVAALCGALDTCISVSTAVSAISAGVGTPTKLLSWKQSPWNNVLFLPYGPLVEIYERNTWEPWTPVIDKIAQKLKGSFINFPSQ